MAKRRLLLAGLTVLVLTLTVPVGPAFAHHDWSAYDTTKTAYLSGFVGEVRWQNPHPEIRLAVPPGLGVPEDLVETGLSEKLEEVGGRRSLERATVPEGAGGEWTIELESPSFMRGVGVEEPPVVGEPVRAVGFLSRQDPRRLRVELIVLGDGRAVSVRESAVATLPTGVVGTGGDETGRGPEDDAEPGGATPEREDPGEDARIAAETADERPRAASWTERIEANPFSELLRTSRWGYPAAEVAHLLGLAVLVGAAVLFDLRLLGFWRALAVTEAARHLLAAVWVGFGVAVATGWLMFVTDATDLAANPAFRLKLALIGLAGLNAVAFHLGPFRFVKKWDAHLPTPARAKVAACVSLAAWAGVVACGRLIAYV